MNIQEANQYIKSKVAIAKRPGFRINFGDRKTVSLIEANEIIELLNNLEKEKQSNILS